MGADEFTYWISFDLLKNEDFASKIRKMLSKDMNKEERAAAIRNMFMQLGNNNATNK